MSIFSALFITGTQAQRTCGSMENLQRLLQENPEMRLNLEKIEQFTQNNLSGTSNRSVYRIPVVFHVVYNTTSENISDAQLQSQLTVLNEDFRRMNADKVNTPSAFTGVAADTEIEFCLATVSPTGAATNGITRTSTTVTQFYDNDAVKYTSQGGKDAWNTGKYLNIWVCDLGTSLLGYAQFPGGPAATDGVVLNYRYTGRGGSAVAPFNKGRTGTHEVGHWLNLYHIWGDAACGNDQVSDTPTQYTSSSGCPTHPRPSCSNSGDQFMNYMDYSDDACMNMLTLGQKSRMRALFATGGPRASLLTSTACGGGTTTPSYCSAGGTNTSYEWIANVKLNTINSTTTGSGGYANYTATSTDLTKGSAYTITLTPGFASSAYTEYFKVYIDFNNDLDFVDAGENVFTSAGTTAAVSASFTVPSTAATAKVRMRVMMKDGSITGPCEAYTYGEVEDYSVNLVSSTTTTTCGTPASLSVSGISSTGATLNWGAVSGAGSYNIRYKASASTTWTSTTSTTTSKLVSGLAANTQYEFQVQAVCSGVAGAYSASKYFTTNTTVTVGTGTATTAIAPYGTYYMDERVQFIITKDELVAAGYNSVNNVIKSLGFNVSTAATQSMAAFTIKIGHTTSTAFASSSFLAPAMTTVFSGTVTAVAGWNTHNFSTAFTYNGVDHVLVDICWNNSSYTTDSQVYYTATSSYRTNYLKTDVSAGGVCANTTGTLSYNRPNMRLVFGTAGGAAKREDETAAIAESINAAGMKLYPNPTSSELNIAYQVTEENSAVAVKLFNMVGSMVGEIKPEVMPAGDHIITIQLSEGSYSELPNGIYLCSISVNGKTETKRFVITR